MCPNLGKPRGIEKHFIAKLGEMLELDFYFLSSQAHRRCEMFRSTKFSLAVYLEQIMVLVL